MKKFFVFFACATDAVLIWAETLNNNSTFWVVLYGFIEKMKVFFCCGVVRYIESNIGIEKNNEIYVGVFDRCRE
jgi:hypothetical protein